MTVTTEIQDLTAATFDETVRGADLPVLVEVWAQWCPPCKTILPVLQALAAEQHDRLQVCKINSDDHPEIATRFAVMAVPTLLVFNEGVLVKRLVGARGKHQLLDELADVIR
jgi:thioredoxin 1